MGCGGKSEGLCSSARKEFGARPMVPAREMGPGSGAGPWIGLLLESEEGREIAFNRFEGAGRAAISPQARWKAMA